MRATRILLTAVATACAISLFTAQETRAFNRESYMELSANKGQPIDEDSVYHIVEKMPEFPGGMNALTDYIKAETKKHYPKSYLKNYIESVCYVNFVVGKDGRLKSINLQHNTRSKYKDFEKEALKIVKNMPLWIPGEQNGTKVNVLYTVPVSFRLPDETGGLIYYYKNLDKAPTFPGGEESLAAYITRNGRYPKSAGKESVKFGRTAIEFIIEKSGCVSNANVTISSRNKRLDEEAVRLVNEMPLWAAGTKDGEAVRTLQRIDIEFIEAGSEKPFAVVRGREDEKENAKNISGSIVGTWQLCQMQQGENGKPKISPLPALKIMNPDGTYMGLFTHSNLSQGKVAQHGRYEIANDSVYYEKITTHMNKKMEGTKSVMKYTFLNKEKSFMRIDYTNDTQEWPSTEFWIRITPLK